MVKENDFVLHVKWGVTEMRGVKAEMDRMGSHLIWRGGFSQLRYFMTDN